MFFIPTLISLIVLIECKNSLKIGNFSLLNSKSCGLTNFDRNLRINYQDIKEENVSLGDIPWIALIIRETNETVSRYCLGTLINEF